MYLFKRSLLPNYFRDMFTLASQIHSYNTRNSNLFYILYCWTNLRKFSIRFQGPTFFNSLSREIQKFKISFLPAANRRRKMRNKLRILTDARRRRRQVLLVHKSLKATRVATLLYVNVLFVVFGFPLASRCVFILQIYICLSSTCEKNCHTLINCLFVISLRLTHEPCLGITIVSLYCFGSPRRKFSNYS